MEQGGTCQGIYNTECYVHALFDWAALECHKRILLYPEGLMAMYMYM